ncbi:MAG: hypothetical protein IB618_03790 [Candidatus Pacearchaeota archaeon]|nr:MAG: hypothetical protein IB618_03790 [Candidatus Pacearchaeota archaeon]
MADINELLDKTEHSLRTVDHMIYITYPLIKENLLLKKVIEQLYNIANNIIEATLQYEYMYKRIRSYQERKFDIFRERCASRFNISTEEIEILKELFGIMEKHKESSFEFTRKDRLVIMSNNLRTESIGLEQLKKYLNMLKVILKKIKAIINKPLI